MFFFIFDYCIGLYIVWINKVFFINFDYLNYKRVVEIQTGIVHNVQSHIIKQHPTESGHPYLLSYKNVTKMSLEY